MSSSITTPTFTETVKYYTGPPIAAACAIVPTIFLFIAKSAMQEGKPFPRINFFAAMKAGINAAPIVGAMVGSQMIAQERFEKAVISWFPKLNETLITTVSSVAIGGISAHALAAFNAVTRFSSPIEAIKNLTMRQAGAIATREALFVFGIRMGDNISEKMKDVFGDNVFIKYAATFTSGALASYAGHPADTFLTLDQAGRKNQLKQASFQQKCKILWRGAHVKAGAVGSFAVCYSMMKKIING